MQKEIRERIQTVNDFEQITQAMKMVAVARLSSAQQLHSRLAPYAEGIEALWAQLLGDPQVPLPPAYFQARKPKHILLLPLFTDKGLCGGLNNHILSATLAFYHKHNQLGHRVTISLVGHKGERLLKKAYLPFEQKHISLLKKSIDKPSLDSLGDTLREGYLAGAYDRVVLLYQTSKTGLEEGVCQASLLPIIPPQVRSEPFPPPIYEPSPETLLPALIPEWLSIQLLRIVLAKTVAEQSTRMITMSQASDNAERMHKQLTFQYNRQRQAQITREIAEIAAGVEALQ